MHKLLLRARMLRWRRRDYVADCILSQLKVLANEQSRVLGVCVDRSCAAIRLGTATVCVAGLTPVGIELAKQLAGETEVHFTAAGRYGPFWWLELHGRQLATVLVTHVRIVPDGERNPTNGLPSSRKELVLTG